MIRTQISPTASGRIQNVAYVSRPQVESDTIENNTDEDTVDVAPTTTSTTTTSTTTTSTTAAPTTTSPTPTTVVTKVLGTTQKLPDTGSSVLAPMLVGATLVALGVALQMATRRRRADG